MKRKKTIFVIESLLGLLILVTACHKEDISTLYSRQYQLSAEITGINAEILRINNEIVELKNLYTILANKPTVTGFDYRIVENNGQKDTIGVDITLDTYKFFIPYGRDGKNGTDGRSPVVGISDDGYWIINGVKTQDKALGDKGDKGDKGDPGKDGINGDTPLISAAKDPDNPADENYYWTIKYPKENNYTFILDGGQKIKATGPKGDKGETLSVDPIIESVVKADDGTSITINLHDGTSYNIPLLRINFKLKPGNLALKDHNGVDSIIVFLREGHTISVPYTSSNNVERIEAMLPAGWSATADISPTDSTKRIIHITSPRLMDLDRAQFEGGATFIAFDQKGASLTQYIKLKLNKYIYMSFFYNELNAVELNRPNSPFNELKWTENHHLLIEFYELTNRQFELKGRFPAGINTNEPLTPSLSDYPSFIFNKADKDVDKQFKINAFLFRPDSVNLSNISGNDSPDGRVIFANQYTASDNEIYMKPVPYDTYIVQYSYSLNNGSNNELIRIRRAATKYKVHLFKASEFLGIDKDDFDYKKVTILLTQQSQLLSAVYKAYNRVPYVAQGNTMTYDPVTDQLECVFCTLGAANSSIGLNFYYDKEGKKRWEPSSLASVLLRPDWEANMYVNHSGVPFPGAGSSYDNYVGYTNNGEGNTRYGGGRVYTPENSSQQFVPRTLPDLK